jgi:ATP-dependent Clp protease ATP-binding subunit ClpA
MASPDPPGDVFQPGGSVRLELFTGAAAAAVRDAVRFARGTRWETVRSPHVFMGLLAEPDPVVQGWVERLGENAPELLGRFEEAFYQRAGDPSPALALHREFLSDNVLRLLRASLARARESGRAAISPTDLLISLLSAPNSIVAECLGHFGEVKGDHLVQLAVLAEQDAGQA